MVIPEQPRSKGRFYAGRTNNSNRSPEMQANPPLQQANPPMQTTTTHADTTDAGTATDAGTVTNADTTDAGTATDAVTATNADTTTHAGTIPSAGHNHRGKAQSARQRTTNDAETTAVEEGPFRAASDRLNNLGL